MSSEGTHGCSREVTTHVRPNERPGHLRDQETEVFPDLVKGQRLIIDGRVDAEATGVWAAQTADHGHDLDGRGLGDGWLDELPALFDSRELHRLHGRAELPLDRPVRGAIAQHLLDDLFARKAEGIVEIPRRVLGVAACMGAPNTVTAPRWRYRLLMA